MSFDTSQLLPLMMKLGNYFRLAVDHYAVLRAAGMDITPDTIASFLDAQMTDWNPELKGRKFLDPATRHAAARFLAGVVCNLATSPVETTSSSKENFSWTR